MTFIWNVRASNVYRPSNNTTCQSPPITIYGDTIPISLSSPDSIEICQGDTVDIIGPTGYSQYNWSNGAITNSITTTTVGDYYLMVTDVNGCSNINSISINNPYIIDQNYFLILIYLIILF